MNKQLPIQFNKPKEIFVPIIGYEGHYSISNYGRIWNIKSSLFIKYHKDKDGYCKINLHKPKEKTKLLSIHRIVLSHFSTNQFNKKEVNHIDLDKTNNNINNLEWVDRKENVKHAQLNGLYSNKNLMKKYEVTFPDGHKEIIVGLNKFCRENNLYPELLSKVAKGKRKHHFNFMAKRLQ